MWKHNSWPHWAAVRTALPAALQKTLLLQWIMHHCIHALFLQALSIPHLQSLVQRLLRLP